MLIYQRKINDCYIHLCTPTLKLAHFENNLIRIDYNLFLQISDKSLIAQLFPKQQEDNLAVLLFVSIMKHRAILKMTRFDNNMVRSDYSFLSASPSFVSMM